MTSGLWRIEVAGRVRLALGPPEDGPCEIIESDVGLAELLADRSSFHAVFNEPTSPLPAAARILAPIDEQEVWAAGVTYQRSREARTEESGGSDFYDRVYAAERPELFFKATGGAVRGPGETVGIRADSTWNVPEPELAVVVSASGDILAYTIANDVSSRSIEGDNPLYLTQAKVYDFSCAVGPCLVPTEQLPELSQVHIRLLIERREHSAFEGTIRLDSMNRSPQELVRWLTRAKSFERGALLLTGTGLVPEGDFTLLSGDRVAIQIDGLGCLTNEVVVVGRADT